MYKDLKLKDLRELFPDIKATSKDDFIAQIPVKDSTVFENESTNPIGEMSKEDALLETLIKNAGKRDSYIVKCQDRVDAEDLFTMLNYELRKRLEKGTPFMSNDKNLEIHISGTTYVRITCAKLYNHHKIVQKYNNDIVIS